MSIEKKTPRRAVLQGAAGLALAWMTPAAAAAQDPKSSRPAEGDLLVRVGDADATPLTPADIATGPTPVAAWPKSAADGIVRSGSRLNRVVLVRVDAGTLGESTAARAAEGIVAYSAVCTHAGCEVKAYLANEQRLYCDCHESRFDAHDDGRVVDGPAPRRLPALPLRVAGGRLEVAGPFTSRPGFEQG